MSDKRTTTKFEISITGSMSSDRLMEVFKFALEGAVGMVSQSGGPLVDDIHRVAQCFNVKSREERH